ncbi:hypothetical protein AQUSIP_00740 [Aquicella siphonis]|uniref:Uncharacterized protein n=1 Tax=Aquicella siphonis TaxID=254247 RepID=A0A5E4PE05_9COXI|nr:hypothetical protein [Aquicella siphonis]VVC74802.1 hypothetical protein AQUSIP_00740 [Aquicella siphonis]
MLRKKLIVLMVEKTHIELNDLEVIEEILLASKTREYLQRHPQDL